MAFGEFFAPHADFSSCEPSNFLEELLVSERTLPALIYCWIYSLLSSIAVT